MYKSLSTYFSIGILLFVVLSFTTKPPKVKGIWKIESVIIDKDTLFRSDSINITAVFFNKQMSGWNKSNSDSEYIEKCIRSTYNNLNQARLNIKRKGYDQSPIMPCWDHIMFKGITGGKYLYANDTLKLIDVNIDLFIDNNHTSMTYNNSEYNYRIRFIRLNDK